MAKQVKQVNLLGNESNDQGNAGRNINNNKTKGWDVTIYTRWKVANSHWENRNKLNLI